ncbi:MULTISPECIES: class II aldolase/adducin family protein [unclassified Streptomyces]|uniref:class II aldolase/adducin family protein n=1 Tax=unclassified Streptomyces TaxID=2593676 RepID=UPI002E804B90|nr:class II aldolase/adducin family protein [Streptomyces sp. NBC_00562]WUC22798.1 class II aldolase/adducin family protein [Streptomyces sp. NBC_00562]
MSAAAAPGGRPTAEPLPPAALTPIPEADLVFPQPPVFDDVAIERRHRKERLAAALRLFGRFGFEEGVAGHITARDPEYPAYFWVNPLGVSFKHIRVSDLLLVNDVGEVVQGRHRVNRAAFAIHSAVHRARPEVIGAAHSHSVYGKALSATGQHLEPLTQDACAFYQDHGLFDDYTGVVNDPTEGRRIADALGSHKAAILRNHGLLTVGTSIDSAAWWFITMERSAQAQLAAKAAGPTVGITDEDAKLTHGQIGSEFVGWFQFQPLFEQISRTDPDLFE